MIRPPHRILEWPLRRLLPRGQGGLSVLGDLRQEFTERARRGSRARALLWYWLQCLRLSVWYAAARRREGMPRGVGLRGWGREIRIGWRSLRRSPRRTALPVLVLSLGIGFSAIALTLLRETLLAPYPFPSSSELHMLWATQLELDRPQVSMSLAEIDDYRRASPILGDIGFVRPGIQTTLGGDVSGDVVDLAFVNSAYFRTLAVLPERGRYFDEAEDVGIGAHPVAVISHGFREARLAGLEDPIGAELQISNTSFTVVGVAPEGFFGPETVAGPVDVWLPVTMSPPFLGANIYQNRAERVFWTVFRAESSAALESVRRDAVPVSARLAEEYPTDHDGWSVRTMPLREFIDGTTRRSAIRLVVAAGLLVLLVSCVNVAGLRLVSAQQRSGEASLRLALGASRGAILRQHLSEGLVLSAVAAVLGMGVAAALVRLIDGSLELPLPGHVDLTLDADAFWLAAVLVAGTSFLVGLLPALAAVRRQRTPGYLLERVHGSGSGVAPATRRWVVGAEVAVTVVFLQIALATLEGFRQITRTPLGFQTEGLLTMRLDLEDGRPAPSDSVALAAYNRARWERRWQFAEQFVQQAPELTGVDAAAVWAPNVLGDATWHARVIHPDLDPDDASNISMAQRHSITPGALAAAGIPIVAGRDLNAGDGTDSIPGVVVDRVLAERFWPGESAVGRTFYAFGGLRQVRVVGVSARARHRGRLHPETDIIGDVFFPYRFWPTTTASLIVRGPGDAATQLGAVRELVGRIDPSIGIYDVTTMDRRLESQESVVRLPAFVMSLLGLIAGLLSGTGILVIVNHTVQTREREIGVRRAFGLDGTALFVTLLGDATKPVLLGAVTGAVAGAVLGTRLVTATTVGGVALAMPWSAVLAAVGGALAVALVAGSLPVVRARRINPAALLRDG